MKIQLALVALAAVVAAEAVSFYEVVAEEWSTWKTLHQKNYSNTMEEKFRLKIFMENKAKIARHNSRAHRGEKSYFLKMNHFGDMVCCSLGTCFPVCFSLLLSFTASP